MLRGPRSLLTWFAFAASCAVSCSIVGCFDTVVLDTGVTQPDAAQPDAAQPDAAQPDAGIVCANRVCRVCSSDLDCPQGKRCDHDGERCSDDNRGPGNSEDNRER